MNSNTSHVPVYQNEKFTFRNRITIQIHLMFLFIRTSSSLRSSIQIIQIHLMFLFIAETEIRNAGHKANSNTSHVPVYPVPVRARSCCASNSNTSHVPVYQINALLKLFCILFKYISCSCLSHLANRCWMISNIQIHLMFLFITRPLLVTYQIL